MLFERFRRQKPLMPISASVINAPMEAVETAIKLTAAPPLDLSSGPMGDLLSTAALPPIWASITAGTLLGPYAWTEKLPAAGGTWTTGFRSGTSMVDPAWNTISATPASLPIIVQLTRDAFGQLRFTAGSC